MGTGGAAAPRVGLLYDSVSENTGDITMGIAGRQEFARHGIEAVDVLDPFGATPPDVDLVVVGGGELIRPRGDVFYDAFRRPARGILNATGVWDDADDLDFLKDFEVVSARTSREAETLSRVVPDAEVVPCTTTTIESQHVDIPGVEPGEPLIGIHIVPHTFALVPEIVDAVNAIPGRKVFLPFTHYNYDDSFMRALPFIGSEVVLPRLGPLQLHSIIGQLDLVVASSLHVSIFAYSQRVPFITARQQKVERYFADRGLERLVFGNLAEMQSSLEAARDDALDLAPLVDRDRAAVHQAYERYAEIARKRAGNGSEPGVAAVDASGRDAFVERIRSQQREQAVLTRDTVIHQLFWRAHRAETESAQLRVQRDVAVTALGEANRRLGEERDELERSPRRRVVRAGWAALRRARNAAAAARRMLRRA